MRFMKEEEEQQSDRKRDILKNCLCHRLSIASKVQNKRTTNLEKSDYQFSFFLNIKFKNNIMKLRENSVREMIFQFFQKKK